MPGCFSGGSTRALRFEPRSFMRSTEPSRPTKTASSAVINNVYPEARTRNLTRESVCPRFGSKLSGRRPYVVPAGEEDITCAVEFAANCPKATAAKTIQNSCLTSQPIWERTSVPYYQAFDFK